MDVACTAVGVDAPTLKRWLALGEAAYRECEEEDPHCRFFEAFTKALEDADQDVEADRRRKAQTDPKPPPRPRAEPRPTQGARASEAPSLVWLVVEEAPIEIVIGSRPPWVYETQPAPKPVRVPEPPRSPRPEDVSSEPTPSEPFEVEPTEPHRDPPIGENLAVIAVGLVTLATLVVVVLAVLAMIPIVLAVFAAIGVFREALGLTYRWRAGLIALRGGTTGSLPIPGRLSWNPDRRRLSPLGTISMDRTSGSVALSGRLRPQRE